MERLNYSFVVLSPRGVIRRISNIYFNSMSEAQRYAEGITAGSAIFGKTSIGVFMHLTNESQNESYYLSVNIQSKHNQFITGYLNNLDN